MNAISSAVATVASAILPSLLILQAFSGGSSSVDAFTTSTTTTMPSFLVDHRQQLGDGHLCYESSSTSSLLRSTSSPAGLEGNNNCDVSHHPSSVTTSTLSSSCSRSQRDNNNRRKFISQSAVAAFGGAIAVASTVTPDAASAVEISSSFDGTTTTKTSGSKPKVYQVAPNSLAGKTILITGGTAGLGLESAKRLSVGGATVIVTARSGSKGETAVQEIRDYLMTCTSSSASSTDNVRYAVLDLDDLKNSVETFPDRLQKSIGDQKVDVLMNNAGVMAVPDLQLTKDGNERTFQSNHLGHFVLTSKLLETGMLAKEATVINVSSEAYNFASITNTNKQGLDLANLNGQVKYGPWSSYGLSKLANILFTQELQRRLDGVGSKITTYSLHPGAVNTDLARNFIGEDKYFESKRTGPTNLVEKVMDKAVRSVLLTVEEGASTQIYLAAASASASNTGKNNYNDDDNITAEKQLVQRAKGEFFVNYKPEKLPDWAKDRSKALELWEESERISGVKFNL